MVDYRFDVDSLAFESWKIDALVAAVENLLRAEFPEVPDTVRVVDYPKGTVRIINLEAISEDAVVDRLIIRLDEVYGNVMVLG